MITTSKIEEYVNSGKDKHVIARWIIDCFISDHGIPLTLNDMADSSTVADEIDAIVDCLEDGDYDDALNIAKDGTISILQDEGFEL